MSVPDGAKFAYNASKAAVNVFTIHLAAEHCLKCQRAEDAGEVDDPSRFALLQQGQKLASQNYQGKQVDVEDALQLLFGRFTRT
jgi:hypothetical protein